MSLSVKTAFSVLLLSALCRPVFALSTAVPSHWLRHWSWLFQVGADVSFPESHADRMPDVVYGRKFNMPLLLNAGIGWRPARLIYIGARYQYWMTTQDYISGTDHITNEFHYQTLGAELGVPFLRTSKTFWILSAVMYFPLELRMSQRGTGKTYKRNPAPYTYEARLTVAVRMSRKISFLFSGGYRYADFGNLKSNGEPFLPPGKSFNMSDVFVGAGLGFTY
jgi:hypothetical protein